ncbi:hypothetical protein TcasGA2_TC031232 [Tribolium castaneum]|uniref:Uncharacterized protein n=1 Tax=Tribolium castaneum TaxID=7070 RepID=A0A139WC16_TRICA|nr:hypothetical protein TcasGA2_TC031232 [Tribolium castaneum]
MPLHSRLLKGVHLRKMYIDQISRDSSFQLRNLLIAGARSSSPGETNELMSCCQSDQQCHKHPSPAFERRKLIKTSKMSNLAGGGGGGGRRRLKCRVTCCPSVKSRTVGNGGSEGAAWQAGCCRCPGRRTDADGRRTAQKWDTYGATSGTADDAALLRPGEQLTRSGDALASNERLNLDDPPVNRHFLPIIPNRENHQRIESYEGQSCFRLGILAALLDDVRKILADFSLFSSSFSPPNKHH